jgi:regulatory protein
MTEKEALNLAMKLCSKKEYASGEMHSKLTEWEVEEETAEKIISQLIGEKFIDDRRYCRAFVNDKLKFSKWGKIKISYMLRQKKVSDGLIREALEAIEPETYQKILFEELTKKAKTIKAASDYEFKGKLIQFAASRGFEYEVAAKMAEKLRLND